MSESLEKIGARLPCQELTLGSAELGPEALSSLASLHVTSGPLVLRGVSGTHQEPNLLAISGTGSGVFGDDAVALELLLIDAPQSRREWLILARRPDTANPSDRTLDRMITHFLSRFRSAPNELFAVLEDVNFCIASSAGFAHQGASEAWKLPDKLKLPLADIVGGVAFHAERVTFGEDITDSLNEWAGLKLLTDGPSTFQILARSSAEGPILCIRGETQSESVSLPWVKTGLAPAQLLVPLEPQDGSAPCFRQSGTLAFPSDWPGAKTFRDLRADVEFDIRWRTTTARLTTPPGFGVFQGLFGDLADQSIMGSLLKGVVGEAWIRGDWTRSEQSGALQGSVLALGGAVGWKDPDPIVLVPDVLTFVGALSFEVDHPFEPEVRRANGRIDGSLRLLHNGGVAASLAASLDIPGWEFTVRAQSTNLGALWQAFGSNLQLPVPLHAAAVTVDLWGDVRSKSFDLAIEFQSDDSEWPGSSDRFKWALRQISLGVSYQKNAFAFGIRAQLLVQDLNFEVVGGYQQEGGAGGWYLQGAIATLDVSKALNNLLQGLALPEGMPAGLTLTDVGFDANFGTGDISVRGRTDGNWEIVNKIGLEIETLSFQRTGGTITAALVVNLTFDEIAVTLGAVKVGGDGGWIFNGSLAPGSKIGFVSLYRKLSNKTEEQATHELPEELRDFSIDKLAVSYETGPKRFEALCSGHLLIQGKRLETTVTVKVEGSSVNCLVAVTFDEHLTFNGKVVIGVDRKAIILGFKDTDQKGVLLTDLLSKALPGDVVLPLQVGLKDALLAYYASETSKGLILGATLDVKFALGDALPPALVALIGKPEIGVDALRVLYSSAALAETDRASLNAHLLSLGQSLPSAGSSDAKGLREGFHASGSLKFGGLATTPLMLPMAESAPASVQAHDGGAISPKADTTKNPSGATWIDIGKSLGPLRIGRVGALYANGKIAVLLDAGVDLAGLRIGLTGFAVHIPLQKGQDVEFGLDGLELAYAGGPVEIAGALLRRRVTGQPDSYDGLAMIKAAAFSISGMGSITTIENAVSVFIFAALHGELGGPPAFRVQGIAGGFGYNRRLTLPPIERVHEFPLVRAAMDASFMRSTSRGGQSPAQAALNELATYVRPSLGDYWLAAGIKFNSFQMVTAVALISVSFGNDVEIGLLGLAEMSLPKGAKEVELAYVELALRCTIRPSDGSIVVEGRLTDASYILSKDCRLTGGFAFCLWFDGPHTGDFVVTLGGYHPEFTPLPHYPVVPRLGVQWQVTKELSFAAELYFALTPSCIMAGGRLAAIYTSPSVRAWFVASVDFLIAWQPLQYRVRAALRIGFEVDVGGSALRLDLRAELILWGPPFSGQLHVDLGILMVTVDFGESYRAPAPLVADQFKKAFLPKISDDVFEVLSARVESGLILQETRVGQSPLHVVSAHGLSLSVQSAVPVTAIDLVDHETVGMIDTGMPIAGTLGVAPMARTSLDAPLKLSIVTRDGSAAPVRLRSAKLSCIQTGVPEALWQPAEKEGELREAKASAGTIPATTGLRLRLDPIAPSGAAPILEIDKLRYEDFENTIPALERVAIPLRQSDETVKTVMLDATVARRGRVLDVLKRQHWPMLFTVGLQQAAAQHEECFRAEPQPRSLGRVKTA